MLERRLVPRYPYERPVGLSSPKGRQFLAEACDISSLGVGMTLSHAAVVGLAQGGNFLTPGDPLRVEIPLPPEQATAVARLDIACRVSHVRRLSQDRFVVAARFVRLQRGQQEVLAALLAELGPGR